MNGYTTTKQIKIDQCWGVGNPRHCSGFPLSKHEYHVPIGCCVAKWNIKTKQRTTIQLHKDVITIMLINKTNVILTVSFHGELKLYDTNYKLLSSMKLPCEDIMHGCWSHEGSHVSICSKNGSILVYSLKHLMEQNRNGEWKFSLPQDQKEANMDIKSCNYFVESVFKENLQVIAASQIKKSVYLYLFEKNGTVIKSVHVSPLGDESVRFLCISEVYKNIVAVGLNRGIFVFYDVDTLEIKTFFQTSSGCQACTWYNSMFFTISYLSGVITAWNEEGTLLHEIKDSPSASVISMTPFPNSNTFFIGGQMSMHQITLNSTYTEITEKNDLSFLQLSGCGISVNQHEIIASGDLSGALLFWKGNLATPCHKITLTSSIRTLLWRNDFLFIGLLSGELFGYNGAYLHKSETNNNDKDNADVVLTHQFSGSVLCMRANSINDILAVATTTGQLSLFRIENGSSGNELKLDELLSALVHKPQVVSGETREMEIWNLIWSPDDTKIATVSEDKTCIISDLSGNQLHQLSGHTTAVTSCDWKILASNTNILTTCADDRTVRIYDGTTFELRHVIEPVYLYGWYTLTYMCVNVKHNMVVCCTENGFVVAWDLTSYECLLKCKLHYGSVEGLVLDANEDFIYSTSADCVVNKYSLVESS